MVLGVRTRRLQTKYDALFFVHKNGTQFEQNRQAFDFRAQVSICISANEMSEWSFSEGVIFQGPRASLTIATEHRQIEL
jgi:hypothetical protein